MGRETPTGRVRLARTRAHRALSGSLWIYAGEIESIHGDPAPGDVVDVETSARRFWARGLFNPHSKIRVRLLTFLDEAIDDTFWATRVATAAALRRRVVSGATAYRVVHAEGDFLPGLVVDRYADVLVLQLLSFGIDRRTALLAELLLAETGARGVYLRNDAKTRRLEGLPLTKGFLRGGPATRIEIEEGGACFSVDIEHGQKTGWFCDQRENRLAVAALAPGAEVLDVFCHTGAFGIQAARAGARAVLGVDASREALALAGQHAEMNEVGARCRYEAADAFDALRRFERGPGFDLVILDPPAFARSKQAVPHALAGYKDINLRALKAVRREGFLATCSCSQPVSEAELWTTIVDAARDAGRTIRLLESRSQAKDHPMLAAMPETRYLKCFLLQVLE
ncbi:class I SAM-dependent rRNA methyltransferase [Candidatus Nitrospira bockiana]